MSSFPTRPALPGLGLNPANVAKRDIPTVAEAVVRFINHRRASGYKSLQDEISVLLGTEGRRRGKPPIGDVPALARSVIGSTPLYRTTGRTSPSGSSGASPRAWPPRRLASVRWRR